MSRIAIMGATGHIARSLISGLPAEHKLFLFARSLPKLNEFLLGANLSGGVVAKSFDEFSNFVYDVIINCVGVGDPSKIQGSGASILRLTETYDNLVLDYLDDHQSTLYIYLSSGAAYGTDFREPACEQTIASFEMNRLGQGDCYRVSKIHAEVKHRGLPNRNIVDLRIFGYFSRFIDLKSGFFLNEVIICLKNGKTLITSPRDITRDYVHPRDLISLIESCLTVMPLNDVFDAYSLKPITKFEMLDYFATQYGLKYEIQDDFNSCPVTGVKHNYYSINKRASILGYSPKFTSLDCIDEESRHVLLS